MTYRYGTAFRAIGATGVFLALALPVAMIANNEEFDLTILVILSAFAVGGIWCYAEYAKYEVTLTPDGFIIHRLFREPLVFHWSDVIAVRHPNGDLEVERSDHRKVTIQSYFPGYAPLREAAARHVPGVPPHSDLFTDPRTSRPLWLWLCRFAASAAVGLLLIGWLAAAALDRLDSGSMPDLVAVGLSMLLVVIRTFAYAASLFLAVATATLFVMYLQDVVRSRR